MICVSDFFFYLLRVFAFCCEVQVWLRLGCRFNTFGSFPQRRASGKGPRRWESALHADHLSKLRRRQCPAPNLVWEEKSSSQEPQLPVSAPREKGRRRFGANTGECGDGPDCHVEALIHTMHCNISEAGRQAPKLTEGCIDDWSVHLPEQQYVDVCRRPRGCEVEPRGPATFVATAVTGQRHDMSSACWQSSERLVHWISPGKQALTTTTGSRTPSAQATKV